MGQKWKMTSGKDWPSLLDPSYCGENLAHNAERVSELAPQLCAGCADYHIRKALHRYTGPPVIFDRPELIRLTGGIIADKAARSGQAVEIVIAGSADTAIIATLAHAAAMLGGEILQQCRFTLVERCLTPLRVCEEFATRHGLDFRPCHADLMSVAAPCPADLIVAHSVFRYIPNADQSRLLARMGGWLADRGRLVLSNRILFDDGGTEAKGEIRKRTAANTAAAEALANSRLRLAESGAATLRRLERAIRDGEGRPGEVYSLDEVRALIRQSGLSEISVETLEWEFAIGPGDVMRRRRAHALLGRADERNG
jgi:hypothetical protein